MAETPGKWRRLQGLSSWQWKVLLTSPFVLFLTWFRLRSVGYVKTLSRSQPSSFTPLTAGAALALSRETSYALAVAVKYGPWRPKCLVRSLALAWFLGRKGIAFEVRIGVPGGKLDFSAHAWVEVEGVVINDKDDVAKDYTPFSAGGGKNCGSGFSRDDSDNQRPETGNRG